GAARPAPWTLFESPCAEQRLEASGAFLRARDPRSPLLLLSPGPDAGLALLERALAPGEARAGWLKHTLDSAARSFALPGLALARGGHRGAVHARRARTRADRSARALRGDRTPPGLRAGAVRRAARAAARRVARRAARGPRRRSGALPHPL